MKELWIKKTIFRRYLVEDNEIDEVKLIIENYPTRAEELICDIYDKNEDTEYDCEEIIIPVNYEIKDL